MNLYTEGVRKASSAIMKPAFHADSHMYGYAPDGSLIEGGPIQVLYDAMDNASAEANKDITFDVDVLEELSSIASVKVTLHMPDGATVVDYHHLMKTEEGWKVISKIYEVL